ncbi:hypothetical protein XA68_17793 [Ophiocordyceps unilateralis]|uniref:Cytochrome P450 n=1 Tax=Ophiocordyceps unilateralis TaxID=268505 RepID=A0A2A9PK74_OPHUN|nr:hypothetical protein XA68_17793 [Ophiocordyceps unilateralis]
MAIIELLEALTWPRFLGCVVLLIVAGFVVDYSLLPRLPTNMARVGYDWGLWGHIKSNLLYFVRQKEWIDEGYAKYGKKGVPFLVPAGFSRLPDVVLPRSMLSWLLDQPEEAVDAHAAHNDIIYGDYNFLDPSLIRDTFGSRAIQRWLNRSLPSLLPAIEDEARHAVESTLGHVGPEWTEMKLWDVWLAVVPPVTNRILAGANICRDRRYLDAVVAFTHAVLRNCVLLRLCPAVLHPAIGRLLCWANWRHWRRADERLRPVIVARLEAMTLKARGEAHLKDWEPPEDLVTWLIRLALEEGRSRELCPAVISKRLLPLEFASIDTTVLTGQLWMLDLLSSPPEVLDAIVKEYLAHQPKDGSPWSKTALLSLVRVDSSIRESQRKTNFHTTLIERVVLSPAGVRLPDSEWILPRGVHLTVNLNGSHHDAEFYQDADEYDALRFARLRKDRKQEAGQENANLPLGMVSMNDHHFPFGHGRFICPGRFFVAHELRLLGYYLLVHYEFRMVGERPRARWIGSGMVPPFGVRVQVRRRQGAGA